ncbi:hypothetical protein E2C01_034489 [Portunus trituberculatus]|uniref:Uncharacterized protein n=1 Tax=Portunus trituberculatus TaxID=210409 RepID=A0A5B7F5T5_PORTR|nr:hypothetical protein [Portunus trituberculatus]
MGNIYSYIEENNSEKALPVVQPGRGGGPTGAQPRVASCASPSVPPGRALAAGVPTEPPIPHLQDNS